MRFLALVASASLAASPASSAELRAPAEAAGIAVGVTVDVGALGDEAYVELVTASATIIAGRGEFSFAVTEPTQGTFDFGPAEALVDFAAEHGMTVRAGDLVVPDGLPAWLTDGAWDAATLSAVLREHVTEVVSHFHERNPGVVVQWDVVGDAVAADGTMRASIWQDVIGPDHLRVAFDAARAADSDATLFYRDFFDDTTMVQEAAATGAIAVPGATADRTTCDAVAKCGGVRAMAADLVDAGVPLQGIAFESELRSPEPMDLAELTAWVGPLGLEWAVTAFGVPVPVTEVANADIQEFQAGVSARALQACLDAESCATFVLDGITDRVPPPPDTGSDAFGGALPFDAADAPKPAVGAMVSVLVAAAPPEVTPATTDPAGDATPVTTPPAPAAPDGDDDPFPWGIVVGAGALVAVSAIVIVLRRRRARTHDDP